MISLEYQILLALALDLMFGDPRWLPHPVRFIGSLAALSERFCRHIFHNERLAGVAAVIMILTLVAATGAALLNGAYWLHPLAGNICSVLVLYFCMAAKDLASHGKAVLKALEADDILLARKKVAMIVGRDTKDLSKEEIARAGIESVAENIVDGITAPLFYAILAGPLGALVYKSVNTLDSIFGYKNERYLHFGWAAARLDDLANFLPARISSIIMVFAAFFSGLNAKRAWHIFIRDRRQHASPNSGHTEAVVAGALGLQLGGVNNYFGKPVEKPTIGDNVTNPQPRHILLANRLLFMTLALSTLIFLGVRIMIMS